MSKKIFLKGTLILACTGLISRIAGFFYRIFLSHAIGAEGLGLYQLVLPLQGLMAALSYTGIQSALSRLIASILLRKLHGCRNRGFFSGIIIAVNAGMNGTERNTDSCYAKKTGSLRCFQNCGSKKICVLKKQKTGCSRKKDSHKCSCDKRKTCLLFLLKGKSGRDQA